jgi:hypothetical protein
MLSLYKSVLPESHLRDKIQGKKILILGSGPSGDIRNWNALDFDYVATVSFWYNRQDLLNRSDILFTAYSNLVDLSNKNLIKYLDTHDTIVGFEEKSGPFINSQKFKDFKNKYSDRYVNFWTSNHTSAPYVGLGGRLIYFMLNFNPNTIYYVGIDGASPTPQNDPSNSFRKGYRPEVVPGGAGSKSQKDIEKSHLDMAKIIHEESKSRGVKLYNLGEGLPFNMSTPYSKQHYPLPDSILNSL